MTSVTIVQGILYIDNPIRRLLALRLGQKAIVSCLHLLSSIVLLGHSVPTKMASRLWTFCIRPFPVTSISPSFRNVGVFPYLSFFALSTNLLWVQLLSMKSPMVTTSASSSWKLWYGDGGVLPMIGIRDKFTGRGYHQDRSSRDVLRSCWESSESFKAVRRSDATATMHFAIVTD